jgi:negative regulator of flagellin synthesis FlgM
MSVTVNNVSRAYDVFQTDYSATVSRVGRTAEKKGSDSVEISSASKDFSSVMKAVMDAPDIRVDKVEDIKSRVALGNYNVSSSAVADQILVANKILDDFYKTHG